MWNRECITATSGARKRTCISGVSRVLARNGPLGPCRRRIKSRKPSRVLVHAPLTVTNWASSRSDSTMASGFVSAPCLIEPQFNLTDRIFICLGHDDLSRLAAVDAPRDCDVRLAGRVSHDFVASVELNAIARVGQDLDDEAFELDEFFLG